MKELKKNSWRRQSLIAVVALMVSAFEVQADTFTFAPGQYDNTANTVTGTNASPVYTNNQTTGFFRDVFWYGTAYNGGTTGVGSPDFINSGSNLVSNGGSPARAVLGGNDTALNFTGQRTSGGATFLTIYDATPGDGAATRNLFSATGGLQLQTDILFAPGGHSVSGGVVALYSEGQDGLALLAHNGGGNNPDGGELDLVFQHAGVGTVLSSVTLGTAGNAFVGDTNGSDPLLGDHWYRIVLDLSLSGDTWTANGKFFNHSDPENPNSALGTQIGSTLTFSGSLSDPDLAALHLTNPGEVGLVATSAESFNDGLGTGGTGANPLTDNYGISMTNFTIPSGVPEPTSVLLMGTVVGLVVIGLRRRTVKRLS